MKKLLTAAIIGAAGVSGAHAALNCCATAPCCISASSSCSYDSSCTRTLTCNCGTSSTGLANKYGIVATTTQKQEVYCVGQTAYSKCVAGTTTYKCARGYYGTATSASAGCTACPANATCAGGNGSTFTCKANYYKNGSTCQPCPNSGKSTAGSTSITSCYLPSGTTFSDSTGSGTYSDKCYYSN